MKTTFTYLLLLISIAVNAQQAEQTFKVAKVTNEVKLLPDIDTLVAGVAYNFKLVGLTAMDDDSMIIISATMDAVDMDSLGTRYFKLVAVYVPPLNRVIYTVYKKDKKGNSILVLSKKFTIIRRTATPVAASPFSATALPKKAELSLYGYNTGFVTVKKTDTLPVALFTNITALDYYDPEIYPRIWKRTAISYIVTVTSKNQTQTYQCADRNFEKSLINKLKAVQPGDKVTIGQIECTGTTESGDVVKQKIKDTYSLTVKQ